MLNAPTKLALERAIPAPWCWYGDLSIPGQSALFTMVLQSEDPVITDLYSSSKSRHPVKFVDILNGGEKCDLSLDQLQEKPMNVLLPGHITHCLRKILNGGLMLLRKSLILTLLRHFADDVIIQFYDLIKTPR